MQRLFPLIVVGVVIASLVAFAVMRLSTSSWVPDEEKAGSEAAADAESDFAAGAHSPRGSKYIGKAGAKGGAAGQDTRAGKASGAGSADGGESPRKGGKGGSSLVVAGRAPRASAYLGESASSRDLGNGSSASIAGDLGAQARDPRTDVGGSLSQPSREHVEQRAEPGQDNPPPGADDVVLSVPLTRDHGTLALDSTAPMIEQDLTFSDDGNGVKFGPNSVLAFPNGGNVRGEAGTVSLDINPEWNGADEGDFSLMNLRTPNDPSDLMRLYKNGKYLRFIFADNTGQERDIGVDISGWQAGEAHNVALTWGDSATALYVDRQLAGQNTYEAPFDPRGVPMYIGSDVPQAPASGAGGTISNFQVLGKALTLEEIAAGK